MTTLVPFMLILQMTDDGVAAEPNPAIPTLTLRAAQYALPRTGEWLSVRVPELLGLGEFVTFMVQRVEMRPLIGSDSEDEDILTRPLLYVSTKDPGRKIRRSLRKLGHFVDGWVTADCYPEDFRV